MEVPTVGKSDRGYTCRREILRRQSWRQKTLEEWLKRESWHEPARDILPTATKKVEGELRRTTPETVGRVRKRQTKVVSNRRESCRRDRDIEPTPTGQSATPA